jgi:hypothetical protein
VITVVEGTGFCAEKDFVIHDELLQTCADGCLNDCSAGTSKHVHIFYIIYEDEVCGIAVWY